MNSADAFLILDLESSNALAYFGSLPEAEGAFVAMLDEQPSRADALALVGIDKEGFPIETHAPAGSHRI